MILLDYKEKILKFIIYINLLLLVLLAIKAVFNKKNDNKEYNYVSTSVIKSETEDTSIYVEYPRFNNNDDVNKIITDEIYGYIKEFKTYNYNKSLDITYNLYYLSDYVNVTFHIENTLSQVNNDNLLINLNTNEVTYVSELFDKDHLQNEINRLVYNKYQTQVYDRIKNEDPNYFTYIIDANNIEVYFNNLDWEDYDYVPYVTIELTEKVTYTNENKNKTKYIALTYDDGPSEYTEEILNVLNTNKVSATFFVSGKNIKNRESVIKLINNSKSEVAPQGYSHTSFNLLTKEEMINEINSTNALFHNLHSDKVEFIRPPYGEYNDKVVSLGYDIVLWNIDSKDWIVRDENKIYNNVVKNACDGCIVLMHDTYKETLEATKRIIPELKKQGYTIVSVSKLMEKREFEKGKGSVINYIK